MLGINLVQLSISLLHFNLSVLTFCFFSLRLSWSTSSPQHSRSGLGSCLQPSALGTVGGTWRRCWGVWGRKHSVCIHIPACRTHLFSQRTEIFDIKPLPTFDSLFCLWQSGVRDDSALAECSSFLSWAPGELMPLAPNVSFQWADHLVALQMMRWCSWRANVSFSLMASTNLWNSWGFGELVLLCSGNLDHNQKEMKE